MMLHLESRQGMQPKGLFLFEEVRHILQGCFTSANGEHLFHSRQQTTVEQRLGSGGVKGNSFKLVDGVVEF